MERGWREGGADLGRGVLDEGAEAGAGRGGGGGEVLKRMLYNEVANVDEFEQGESSSECIKAHAAFAVKSSATRSSDASPVA